MNTTHDSPPCGYRFCDSPDAPIGRGHHLRCVEAHHKMAAIERDATTAHAIAAQQSDVLAPLIASSDPWANDPDRTTRKEVTP